MSSGTERADTALRRSLGLRESVTITVGTVIGVGLFTVGANVVGLMGAAVILPTFIAMLVSIYPALLYAEMGAALPYAGGTYKYASLGLNRPMGMLAAWNFIISLVAVTSGEALAFSFYLKTACRVLGWELPLSDVAVACLVVALFIATNVCGVEITGRLQNGFMFFFWGVALVWFLMMMPHIRLPYFAVLPDYVDFRPASLIGATAMIWWCFAGFETCCAMGEEIRYPQINIPRALFLAPFIVFAVNALFQGFIVGIVPTESLSALSKADAPYAEAMATAGLMGIPLLTLALGIAFGGDFSTLNASIAVPPRYLFTMARDGAMPRIFAAVHPRYRTPWVAILFLGGLSIALIATGSIVYIASLSLFADLFYYVIGIAASLGLRFRRPDLKRPYRAPAIAFGAPVSAVLYVVMMSQLDRDAFWTGIVWCVLGLVVFWFCRKKYGDSGDGADAVGILAAEEPKEAEKLAMDREYRWWCAATALAVLAALSFYALPFFTQVQ